ncbi:MAG: hypothetical protein GF411_12420 [Candidatus Lokiarchaeota archaeon]|nr:hypothetical protein [Candidatus Lokiarchaeota archaeon]
MSFKFIEVEKDGFFLELERVLGFVSTEFAQYHIDSDVSLKEYDFHDRKKYREFFKQFAESENEAWKLKTTLEWDFSIFPYRESTDFLKGIFHILRTGGAYGEDDGAPYQETEALEIVSKYDTEFKRDSEDYYIFDTIIEDVRGMDMSGGFGIPDETLELKSISQWFYLTAWDDLIFVLNLHTNTLYVMAYTDSD